MSVSVPSVAAQPTQPPRDESDVGNLGRREVLNLKIACLNKDSEDSKVISTLLSLTSLVIAVWTGLMIGGFAGFIVGWMTLNIVGGLFGAIHNRLRNHDYADAGEALATQGFKQFLADQHASLDISTIVHTHKAYKSHLAARLVALA